MSFTVVETEGGAGWDQLVTDLGGSPLISGRWLEAVSSPRRRPIYLRLADPSGMSGAIAGLVLEPSGRLLRRYGRRLFFYSGPALSVAGAERSPAVQAVVDFARRSAMAGVVFRSWDYPHAFEYPQVVCHRSRRREFVLDLRGDMTALDARMRPQVHRQVRQALHAGLTFHEAESAEVLDDLLRLMEETRTLRRAKGYDDYDYFYMPHLSPEALTQLLRSGLARVFCARRASEVISVVMILVLGGRAVALLIGTKTEGYRLKAPSLVWHEAARQLKLSGVQSLNLLGVPPGPGGEKLAFFKMALGCERFPCADGATGLLQRSPMYLLAKLASRRRIGWT